MEQYRVINIIKTVVKYTISEEEQQNILLVLPFIRQINAVPNQ